MMPTKRRYMLIVAMSTSLTLKLQCAPPLLAVAPEHGTGFSALHCPLEAVRLMFT